MATLTHWAAFRAVGLKTEGGAWPEPTSAPVKVFVPKWRKRAMSDCCHWSWLEVGMGRSGSGGGVLRGEEREWGRERREKRRRKEVWRGMGWVNLEGLLKVGL